MILQEKNWIQTGNNSHSEIRKGYIQIKIEERKTKRTQMNKKEVFLKSKDRETDMYSPVTKVYAVTTSHHPLH